MFTNGIKKWLLFITCARTLFLFYETIHVTVFVATFMPLLPLILTYGFEYTPIGSVFRNDNLIASGRKIDTVYFSTFWADI